MRKISLIMLLGVWAIGLVLFALDAGLQRNRLRIDAPAIRAQVQARRNQEAARRADSAIAYATAPITVTRAGDTIRALAYASGAKLRAYRAPLWLSIPIALWFFKVPIALIAITLAWITARFGASAENEVRRVVVQ